MEIITKGHEAKNAVQQILQLFFSLDDSVFAESVLEGNISRARVVFENCQATGEAVSFNDEKMYVTNAIKKAVFHACKKLSQMPTPWGISTGIRPAKNVTKLFNEGFNKEYVLNHLKDEFLIEDNKARLSIAVAEKEKAILDSMGKNSVSIYVGIPFCPSRCSYCSFISQATEHNNKFVEPYTKALIKEIEHSGKLLEKTDLKVESVYFGGGTPTAIPENLLESIIVSLKDNFDLSTVKEFCVEAGRPDTFSKQMMDMLVRQKVGRISINPQSMHQKTLDKIGRKHSVEDIKRAFYLAHEAGIQSINADLIAGLPDEDEAMMEYSVNEILKENPQAVTVHTLYMKRAADLIDSFSKLRFTNGVAGMVNKAYSLLTNNGFDPYYMYKQRNTLGNLENVSYARSGHESIYNVYIMEEVQPILALGAGGSSKIVTKSGIDRIYNPKEAGDYTNRIDEVLQRKDNFFKYYE